MKSTVYFFLLYVSISFGQAKRTIMRLIIRFLKYSSATFLQLIATIFNQNATLPMKRYEPYFIGRLLILAMMLQMEHFKTRRTITEDRIVKTLKRDEFVKLC
jgi:hypothetical protein